MFKLLTLISLMTLASFAAAAEPELKTAAEKIVEKTNNFRKEHDLAETAVDQTLQQTAQKFADFMAESGKYGHRADGRTPAERASAAGYDYCVVRENIAFRTDTRELTTEFLAEHFTQGWIDSPEHRENMLADYVTETAVALASDDGTTFYAVQLFGRPKAMAYEVTIRNQCDSAWMLRIESNGGSEEIEIPKRGQLRMKRCFPITLSIADTDARKKVSETSELAIHETAGGPAFQ